MQDYKPTENIPYDGSAGDPMAMIAGMMGMFGIIWLAMVVFFLFLNWKIVSKAGYNGALSLLMLIPLVNLVMYVIFAFSEWPVQKQARGASPVKG